MRALEAILTRRTVHDYTDREVDPEYIRQSLEAAIRAPNHKLTNPWRFYELGPKSRAEIADIAVLAKREFREITEREEAGIRKKMGTAPVLLLVSQVLDADPGRRKEDYASVACAIQNFSLAMWDFGVSTKWSTGPFTKHPRTYQLIGIDEAQEEIVGGIFAGYPECTPDTPRRPLEAVYQRLD